MVSINGLPPVISSTKKTSAKRKREASAEIPVDRPTPVAQAVSQSIRTVNEADIERATLQYDLPDGNARKALEEYMTVVNQSRKEELAQLLGVDLYI